MTTPILSELLQRTTALRALACELVGDGSADDVLQESAIQTLTAPPQRSGPAGGWLVKVVRNVAGKHRRAERIRRRHEAAAARADRAEDDSAVDADILRRLTELVTSLPEPYRATILARYLREQTPSEIAAATATPVRTVKTRLQRGLTLLRERFDEHGDDWRGLLAAAFAIDPGAAPNRPTPSTIMKLVILAAALLPIGYALWTDEPDSSTTPDRAAARGAPGDAEAVPASGDVASAATDRPAPAAATPTASGTPLADRPLIRIDAVGPAAFRAAFLPTNIGELFASEDGERLWRPLLRPAEAIWRQWDGRDEFAATRERALDYAGRIRVLWLVEPGEGDERDRVFGVFALERDAATDLSALAADLSHAMLGFMPDEPTARTVGDHELRMFGGAAGDFVTIPVLIDGSLVAFFGEAGSLDETVPRGLRALAMDDAEPAAPLSLHVDLEQLQHLSEMRGDEELAALFGLESLRSLQATVRPNGAHAQLELEVVFGDGDRGVFAGLLPAIDTLPNLLARVPPDATPWLTVPFRPDLILRAGLSAAAPTHDDGIAGLRRDLYDEFGLDLDTELLDHVSGEMMVLGDLWRSEDPDVFRRGDDPPLGACIVWSLADAAAFDAGLSKLLDYLKGHVHRHETREVDGVEITRLGTIFLTGMHLAVGDDLAALAFGKEGVAQLEALVKSRRPLATRVLPAAVQRVEPLAPPGWNGAGVADLTALFGGQVALVFEMLDDSLPPAMRFGFDVDETQELLDRLLPLVTRHRLQQLVTMTGHHDGHWRLRVLW